MKKTTLKSSAKKAPPPRKPRSDGAREKAALAVFARAAGRRVFGFTSDYPSGVEVKLGKVPPEFDYLCVEGDEEWVKIPRESDRA